MKHISLDERERLSMVNVFTNAKYTRRSCSFLWDGYNNINHNSVKLDLSGRFLFNLEMTEVEHPAKLKNNYGITHYYICVVNTSLFVKERSAFKTSQDFISTEILQENVIRISNLSEDSFICIGGNNANNFNIQ